MEEEEKKNKLVEWIENHPKTIFITRAVLWCIFAGILPFSFIAWRYGLFKGESSLKLSGWGLFAIVLAAVFIISLCKYIYKGMQPGTMAKQCAKGAVSIILPLVVFYLIVWGIEQNITLFKQALGCVILCELVAIPINPFPAWVYKRQIEHKIAANEGMADMFWSNFFRRKNDEEKKNG